MHSFIVSFALFLARLLCSWLQRILGDYVGLESLVDSCLLCCKVEIRDHYYLGYVTIVFHFILLVSVITLCELIINFIINLFASVHLCDFETFLCLPRKVVLIVPGTRYFFG